MNRTDDELLMIMITIINYLYERIIYTHIILYYIYSNETNSKTKKNCIRQTRDTRSSISTNRFSVFYILTCKKISRCFGHHIIETKFVIPKHKFKIV